MKNPKIITEIEVGDTVVCDICNEEYTDSKESGGFIYSGYAYCPKCAVENWKRIEEAGDGNFIQAICPKEKSFADFCREYRGENAKITITEL